MCVCASGFWLVLSNKRYIFILTKSRIQHWKNIHQNQQSAIHGQQDFTNKISFIVLLVKKETTVSFLTSSFCWRYRSLAAQSRSGSVASAPQKFPWNGKTSRIWKQALMENAWMPLAIIPQILSSHMWDCGEWLVGIWHGFMIYRYIAQLL